jgi:hypothetical protein
MPEITSSNPEAFKELLKRLEQLKGASTRVGWFEGPAYPDGRPVYLVAEGNEFGIPSRSIPARPMFRPTIAEHEKSSWPKAAETLVKRVVEGKMSGFEAMDTFGQIVQNDVASTITNLHSPPLSQITLGARKYRQEGKKVTGATIGEIARKLKDGTLDVSGVSDKPLEDSFTMFNTLTHVTEKT